MRNPFEMLKQAHSLRKEMGRIDAGLAAISAEGIAGGGAVRIGMDGRMRITAVSIAPELLARGDAHAIERMVLEASNDAREKAQRLAAEKMRALAGGLPGPS
ncbi:MAG: YbaB/EbfC family nucleoid-associated protein [bacterium]|nr:YbaB/EbfC family nucleoid-associated protein [bacterium]